jgi:BirA family biotin operon repressor/biotin-[acetyl-CoA-carboxylase] ligase
MTKPTPDGPLNPAPLDTEIAGARVLVFDEVDSTNARALASGGHGDVFVAERQMAGRGRFGRPWHSASGLGLWFSVALHGPWPGLGFAAPLAVRDGLRTALHPHAVEPSLKWPNDILLRGRKCCGILAEARGGRTALGIGLNVAHRDGDFPPELRGAATSLTIETGGAFDRSHLLRLLLRALDRRLCALRDSGLDALRDEWAAACAVTGRRVTAAGLEGVVTGIDDHGALLVSTSGGTRTVPFGESVRIGDIDRTQACCSQST